MEDNLFDDASFHEEHAPSTTNGEDVTTTNADDATEYDDGRVPDLVKKETQHVKYLRYVLGSVIALMALVVTGTYFFVERELSDDFVLSVSSGVSLPCDPVDL